MAQINSQQTNCHSDQVITAGIVINTAPAPHPNDKVSLDKVMESLKEQTKAVGNSFESVKLPFYDRECRMDDLYMNIECKRTDKKSWRQPRDDTDTGMKSFEESLIDLIQSGKKRIVMEGDGGIGKTTATKKLCLDWARDQGPLKECFDAVVRVDLKRIEMGKPDPTEMIVKAVLATVTICAFKRRYLSKEICCSLTHVVPNSFYLFRCDYASL